MENKKRITYVRDFFRDHFQIRNFIAAFILTFTVEALARGGAAGAFLFLVRTPLTFLCNLLIIFVTLSVSALASPRSRFVRNLIILFWLICGVVNCIVLRFRMTPFSVEDLNMVPSLMRIAKNYLSSAGTVIIIAAGIGILGTVVGMWFFVPKDTFRVHRFAEIIKISSFAFCLFLMLGMGTRTEAISTDFQNLADAYEQYGFAYCFSTTIMDVGIDKPEAYSEETLQAVASDISRAALEHPEWTDGNSVRPNIIMIQLESFIDPTRFKGTAYSQDPIPVMRSLAKDYASGYFNVPVVGAGTANTEFEVLSGMSVDYFGAGEYPYNTVLKDTPAETAAHILRPYGYTSTVVHNNTGTFYNRDTVFSMLGFDQFIPAEYLYEEDRTPNNWMKDKVLTDVITDTLSSTEGRDFIYTITVQSHGRYPQELVLDDPAVSVLSCPEHLSKNALEYYASEISEVDAFVGALTDALESFSEPTVLVLYGDHLPALGFGLSDINLPDLYKTEYVIWNNFGDNIPDQELAADEITGYLLRRYSLAGGILPIVHGLTAGETRMDEMLCLLEYDMLYGDGYVFSDLDTLPGENYPDEKGRCRRYRSTDLKIGYKPISVTGCEMNEDGILTVYGENFNESSAIMADGVWLETEYINHQTLRLCEPLKQENPTITVGQFDENGKQLGEAAGPLPRAVVLSLRGI